MHDLFTQVSVDGIVLKTFPINFCTKFYRKKKVKVKTGIFLLTVLPMQTCVRSVVWDVPRTFFITALLKHEFFSINKTFHLCTRFCRAAVYILLRFALV